MISRQLRWAVLHSCDWCYSWFQTSDLSFRARFRRWQFLGFARHFCRAVCVRQLSNCKSTFGLLVLNFGIDLWLASLLG